MSFFRRSIIQSVLSLICLLPAVSLSQTENPISVAERLADHIMQGHNHELYEDSLGHCHIRSYYQEWRYVNGVLGLGMQELAKATGKVAYRQFVSDNFAFFFNPKIQQRLKRDYDEGLRDYGYHRFFTMGSLDDCGAMGASLAQLWSDDRGQKVYADYLERIAQYILHEQSRMTGGVYSRGKAPQRTVWADDQFMSLSFLTRYGQLSNRAECLDTAAVMVGRFHKLLADPGTGLYWHCYYEEDGAPGVAHWGRAMGWCLLAQAFLLDALPEQHPQRAEVLRIFRANVRSICRYQSASGMWHQLLDKADSYEETSCTAMFTYAVARGVSAHWLDASYKTVALRGWEAVADHVDQEGTLKGVCMGTGLSRDLPFYYSRPAPDDDVHGMGAVILAALAVSDL